MSQRVTAKPGLQHAATITFAAVLLTACGQPDAPSGEVAAPADAQPQSGGQTTEAMETITELQIIEVDEGEGAAAAAGQSVIVHYTGWLYDPSQPENKGTKFDSSVDRGQPFSFPLGAGRVIKGWDQGVAGMFVGGKRLLVIPPDLGYGSRGAGAVIPPDATLLFEVELLEIQ